MNNQHATNSTAPASTRADAARAAYSRAAQLARPSQRAQLRTALVAGVLGILIGAGAAFNLAGQLAPLAGAQQVTNAEVIVQNDDSRWLLISGWAIRLPSPLAPAGE